MDSEKVKILFISHEYSIGGSTMSLISLICGIKLSEKNNGLEIGVLLPYKKNGMAKRAFGANNIDCKQMWYRRDFKKMSEKYSLKNCLFDLLNAITAMKLSFYIHKKKYNIVCSNSTGVDVGARAAKLAKVPHIYYVREFMELDHGIEYRNKKRMKSLLENSASIIFISKAIEQHYKTKYRLKNTVQFYEGFIVGEYYTEHNILNGEKLSLIQMGNYQEGKGTINTIQMLHILNDSGFTEWEMEFVGKGTEDYIRQMEILISQYKLELQITISGFCTNVKEKLSRKDILIMNSRSEGFGRVTVEGMLAGCLVIGRNSGGTAEIITDKVNGLLFENEVNFVNIIKKVYANRDTYKKIAKLGQINAMGKFNYINTSQDFINIVEKCM